MKKIKYLIKQFFNLFGLEISYGLNDDIVRRLKLMKFMSINKVFDIGANVGNYGKELRKYKYDGKIFSFEPINNIFIKLNETSLKYNDWDTFNYALGDSDTYSEINVSEVSDTSSILDLLPEQILNAPQSIYVRREKIEIKTLDSIFSSFVSHDDRVMIKIDTQGFEKKVLEGASKVLNNVSIIQLEMSFVQLYQNETLFFEMNTFLNEKGFFLYSIENGFSNKENGRLLQADGIYINVSKIIS